MLRVRSLNQISEPKSRVQAAGRYGNLEAKPSRKKLRGFVIKKNKKTLGYYFARFSGPFETTKFMFRNQLNL